MAPIAIPDDVYARFRAVSFERLERIESTWLALTHGSGDTAMEEGMYRDLHTLKGDARVVGFVDVAVLAQRLEDMLAAARARRYRVHEDVDIVVNMGLQFIGMLLRKKMGAARGGIDLDGFLKQLEEVLAEWMRRSSEAPALGAAGPMHLRFVEAQDRAPVNARNRLSTVATSVFLETLRTSSGAARSRLRDVWRVLAREVALLDATPLAPMVERHAAAASQLAHDLKKNVTIVRDVKDAAIAVDVLDAVNTAILHATRNAVDHGMEVPDVRNAAGKPEVGTVAIRAAADATGLSIVVQDDGAGIDLARVRQRAVARGVLGAGASTTDAQLLEFLFLPGFSTRDAVTDVSGRGVGLDAVRAAIVRVGGRVEIASTMHVGTTLTIHVPQSSKTVEAHVFRGARTSALFAVPVLWTATFAEDNALPAVDLTDMLALPSSGTVRPRVLQLRSGRTTISVAAGGPLDRMTVKRLCPTPEEDAIEVVEIPRGEALLVRPERLLAERPPHEEPP